MIKTRRDSQVLGALAILLALKLSLEFISESPAASQHLGLGPPPELLICEGGKCGYRQVESSPGL